VTRRERVWPVPRSTPPNGPSPSKGCALRERGELRPSLQGLLAPSQLTHDVILETRGGKRERPRGRMPARRHLAPGDRAAVSGRSTEERVPLAQAAPAGNASTDPVCQPARKAVAASTSRGRANRKPWPLSQRSFWSSASS